MVTSVNDVFPFEDLALMVEKGYVRRQTHPTLPFAIYNYTKTAQFDRVWTPVTLVCRGLVTRLASVGAAMEAEEIVVSRPFPKFFNHGEQPDVRIPVGEQVVVTEKMDGSLGISVPTDDGVIVATRGSFTSDQAVHATSLLAHRYPTFVPEPGVTYLWEIIYPENRIVVDYGAVDDLVLLGAVNTATGRSLPLLEALRAWYGPVVDVHPYSTLADALIAPQRDNVEGVVIHFVESDLRLKLKQADYVALHKVVTNLSERSVWETLAEYGSVTPIVDVVPDEYFAWVHEVSDRLRGEHASLVAETHTAVETITAQLAADGITAQHSEFRKLFAGHAASYPNTGWIFASLDGRNFDDKVWRAIKPDAIRPAWMLTVSEDAN